jgi:pyrrolidone-carboxylate peptidase
MGLIGKARIIKTNSFDDRELYWARLLSSKIIRTSKPQFAMTDSEQTALLTMLENGSRGRTDLDYSKKTDKRILITGFDPFLLDRNINQSNPSGVAALLLDGQVINYNGISAEINTVMVPVRYEDFDQGIIESLLAPYYALNNVDMIATISMGSKDFDLERFPGKRRSVTAPDNANIVYGGTATAPKISSLNDRPLPGNEFVTFSLPVKQMQKAKGPFPINDNHKVVTLEKAFEPKSLKELEGAIAVKGGGGGYLSNEISYRSIRLRDELNSDIPTGHIHTPRIQQFEPETEAKIVKQIKAMLEQSLVAI